MTTKLKSDVVEPFSGSYSDWYCYEEDKHAVVTFVTLDQDLFDIFEADCVWHETEDGRDTGEVSPEEWAKLINQSKTEKKIDVTKFDKSKLRKPGAYKDKEDERCYTVILPYNFITDKFCQKRIKKLNKKFDEDFELYFDCHNCGDTVELSERYESKTSKSLEEHIKTSMIFCSEGCFEEYGLEEEGSLWNFKNE